MRLPKPSQCLLPPVAAGLALLALAGCFNSNQASTQEASGPGRGVLNLVRVEWGRLVNVADIAGTLVQREVLIRQDLEPDGVSYELALNPVTEEETLTILQPAGSAAFDALLTAAQAGINVVETKGPTNAPPFPYIPRNAAIRLSFSELVDPSSVKATTIQVWTGDPPVQAMTVRYLVQNDAGARRGTVLLDPTISARQAAQLGLPQNSTGLPASFDSVNDNVMLRIPTKVNTTFGQPEVLRNLKRTRNITPGPSDPLVNDNAGNPVVVRSLRSGNSADLFNGFLKDVVRPSLITVQDTTVTEVVNPSGAIYELTYFVNALNCRELTPKTGDVIELGQALLVVTAVLNSGNPLALEVRANALEGVLTPGTGLSLSGRLTTRYTPQDALRQACYLGFTPSPTIAAGQPITVDPYTSVTVRFSEPIDPTTVLSMHSLVLTAYTAGATDVTAPYLGRGPETVAQYIDRQRGYHRLLPPQTAHEYGGRILFGPVEVLNGAKDFILTPLAGFTDPDGNGAQSYSLALRDGQTGVRDLAGNPVEFTGFVAGTPLAGVDPELLIAVDATGGTVKDKYFALRGGSVDESGDGLPEYCGQFGVSPGKITGRTPERFARVADSGNEFIGAGTALNNTTLLLPPYEPLNPSGAVVMGAYRPHDLGLSYFDKNEYNIDVEGMSWSPMGGVVNDDTYGRFALAFAHANQMPDEVRTITGLPAYPNSGLFFGGEFDDNILGFDQGFNERIVSDTEYTLRAVNLFSAVSGSAMLPFESFTDTYTWRDTAIPQSITGASGGIGAPPSTAPGAGFWGTDTAPSVALPLLVRWRCYPRGNFLGSNQFQSTNMIYTAVAQGVYTPAFRIYSSGGEDAGGRYNPVIPDNSAFGGTRPSGGFINGQPTPNHDQNVYWAQVDFVVKVSRVHTHWFDMGRPLGATGDAIGLLLEPDAVNQDPGTAVIVEFRGSASVTHPADPSKDPSPLLDACLQFDDYADFVQLGGNTSSVSTPGAFTTDLRQLEGQPQPYQFFQLRFSFVSNAEQDLQSYLDGFGFCWKFN